MDFVEARRVVEDARDGVPPGVARVLLDLLRLVERLDDERVDLRQRVQRLEDAVPERATGR